jgi:hypothetical protein
MDTTRTVSGDGDAKLVYRSGERYGEVLQVKGYRVTIGRSATNDIVLAEAGMVVSSFHAVVNRASDGSWWVEDLNSKNGTFVNRRRVGRQRLQEADVISLAPTGPVFQFTTLTEDSGVIQTSWDAWKDTRTAAEVVAGVAEPAKGAGAGSLPPGELRPSAATTRPDQQRFVAASVAAVFFIVLLAVLFFVLHDSGHHEDGHVHHEPGLASNGQAAHLSHGLGNQPGVHASEEIRHHAVGSGSSARDEHPSDAGASHPSQSHSVQSPSSHSDGPVEITAEIDPIYGSLFHSYRDQPIGTVTVTNTSSRPAIGLTLSFGFKNEAKSFLVEPFLHSLPEIPAGGSTEVIVLPRLSTDVLLHETREVTTITRVLHGRASIAEHERALYIHGRNVFNWENPDRISAFIDPLDPAVEDFVQAAWRQRPRVTRSEFPPARFQDAVALITALADLDLRYRPDPRTPISSKIDWKANDRVNFPWQTLTGRSGDCDDLSVLCASVLEAAQIRSVIAVGPQHVLMMFDSGLDESHLDSSPLDPDTVVPWKGRIWIPIETTNLGEIGSSFATAWGAAWVRRQEIIEEMDKVDVRESWAKYSPMNPASDSRMRQRIDAETWVMDGLKDRITSAIANLRRLFQQNLANHAREITDSLEDGPDRHRELGLLYARNRLFGRARLEFELALFGSQTDGLDDDAFDEALAALPDDRPDVPFLLMNYGTCVTLGEGDVDRLQLATRVYRLGLEKLPQDDTLPERADFLLRLALVHRLQGDLASERTYRELAFGSDPTLRETYDDLVRGQGARAGADTGLREYLLGGLR